ncbi:MAG: hypothetical protein GY878_14710 [Fuerstiella sp.]|nr:hypothetical protein [Fuerstiella sp.]
MGQFDFERPPIDYHNAPAHDPIIRLQQQMDAGDVALEFDETHGYLPSLLKTLDVPVSSQVLVFSKTSLQIRHINPQQPRAIYFNDDVYIGNTRFGEVFEVSAVDPQLGGVFYTLNQSQTDKPRFVRDKGQCLTCHASSRTADVPGHLIRSVFPDRKGHPIIGSGTFTTDHTSPFTSRWGGWYVTGTHGSQRHMGNEIVASRIDPEKLDTDRGANVTDLSDIVNVKPYLSPHSDLVALMVLEHQAQMHNLIARASFETRVAEENDRVMNKMLDRDPGYRSDLTGRRINRVASRLVEYMLYCGEYRLTSPVVGTSGFAQEFPTRGPHDKSGRSLRDLDLKTRLMKYPCSYLIYSQAFDQLPLAAKQRVYQRLTAVLNGADESDTFAHLAQSDRQAILEILTETKPELQAFNGETANASLRVSD